MGRFYDLNISQLYYVETLNNVGIFNYYSYIHANIGSLSVVTLHNTIRNKHCSSRYYSLKLIFIAMLSLEKTNTIHKIHTIHTNSLTLFIIRTSISIE